jgi:hypothetical protein
VQVEFMMETNLSSLNQTSHDLVVDYSQEVVPALSKADAVWRDELLREQGLR